MLAGVLVITLWLALLAVTLFVVKPIVAGMLHRRGAALFKSSFRAAFWFSVFGVIAAAALFAALDGLATGSVHCSMSRRCSGYVDRAVRPAYFWTQVLIWTYWTLVSGWLSLQMIHGYRRLRDNP